MSPSKLIRFKSDVKKVIDESEDFVCIIKLMNDNVFGEESLGNSGEGTGEDLII
ncbi:CRISPR-associated endonuclease Cas2 [uncultured Clostridium sp.]|uniref:CRISPR-associated endonuclease Cas2 n=1 Tax=uncultured Clostridium sp. TaxID=59620 RepID=UPI003456E7D8